MKQKRPVNLNLFTIRFPMPAIVSILHRISGVILFIFIPFMLMALRLSLTSPETFDSIHQTLTTPFAKFIIWVALSAFMYHFVAGIRHLLMDINLGAELRSGKIGAWITMIVSAILIILTGIWVW